MNNFIKNRLYKHEKCLDVIIRVEEVKKRIKGKVKLAITIINKNNGLEYETIDVYILDDQLKYWSEYNVL